MKERESQRERERERERGSDTAFSHPPVYPKNGEGGLIGVNHCVTYTTHTHSNKEGGRGG